MNNQQAITAFAALSHEARLNLVRLLVQKAPAGLTPKVMTEMLGIPAATLSFHLKELTQSGLVTQTRQGRNLVYRPSLESMASLMDFLSANCCEGQPCILSPEAQKTKAPESSKTR